jgi:pyruvate dehydrogenase E2 component (dihydrolipoamide acetyltransferase)
MAASAFVRPAMAAPATPPRTSDLTLPGGPALAGVSEQFREAGGIRFRYLEGGNPAGAPVLFLHGWPTWAEVWLPVASMLPQDRRWIALDLPNHGKSDALKGKTSLTTMKAAVVAFFDELKLERAAVVGCSIGGTLAVMLAIARPQQVERICVIDAAGFGAKLPGKTVRMYLPFFLRTMFGAPPEKAVRKLLNKAVFADKAKTTDAWVRAVTAAFTPKASRKALRAVGGALRKPDASVGTQIHGIACPVLVLWGQKDRQFPWQVGEAASRGMRTAKFIQIPDAGHFPMVEYPERTAEALVPFLSQSGGVMLAASQ